MIKSIHFQNFKALRDATLPLGRFTLIVGPNGSGKSSAMQALSLAAGLSSDGFDQIVSAELRANRNNHVSIAITWDWDSREIVSTTTIEAGEATTGSLNPIEGPSLSVQTKQQIWGTLKGFRLFSFAAKAIAAQVRTEPKPELGPDGSNLAAVLDAMRDTSPERFEALNLELARWLPEFDRILFETPSSGQKAFVLRTKIGGHQHHASALSDGTLFALALLSVAYLPSPPPIVCFEEPDHGIHPRLLAEIQDGMYRLAYPESFGEDRAPVQVIATTHSPYLLDLYKEHPEEIVIAYKDERGAHFDRLSDRPYINEILEGGGAPLGEIWFSGVLGGVPSSP